MRLCALFRSKSECIAQTQYSDVLSDTFLQVRVHCEGVGRSALRNVRCTLHVAHTKNPLYRLSSAMWVGPLDGLWSARDNHVCRLEQQPSKTSGLGAHERAERHVRHSTNDLRNKSAVCAHPIRIVASDDAAWRPEAKPGSTAMSENLKTLVGAQKHVCSDVTAPNCSGRDE